MSKESKPTAADGLEVVAWQHWGDQTKLLCALGKDRGIPGGYADEFTHPLCRLTDAQRLLSQLREELAKRDETLALVREQRDAELITNTELEKERDQLKGRIAALESQQAASVGDARPTGLSKGWNLVRQCDGFVIRHSSEEPAEKYKASALAEGRVYVPFLVAASVGGEEEVRRALDSYAAKTNRHVIPKGISQHQDQYVEGWLDRAALSPAGGGVDQVLAQCPDCPADQNPGENYASGWNECKRYIAGLARLNAKPQANSQEVDEK